MSGGAPWALVLLVCVPALGAGVWLYVQVERRAAKRHRVPTSGIGYGVAVGLLYGVSSLAIKGTSSRLRPAPISARPRCLCWRPPIRICCCSPRGPVW